MKPLTPEQIADAKNARGCGVPLSKIADHLGVTVDELRAATGLPPAKCEPAGTQTSEFDLFRVDELDAKL